jgi:molybdate transport system substrate-binding protein
VVALTYSNAPDLARRIERGEPADVFASASAGDPARLHALGLTHAPAPLAANRLVVAVPATSPADGHDILIQASTRLVIEAEGIPLGDYTRELLHRLDRRNAGFADAVHANVVHEEQTVDAVARRLYDGDADAAVLYATDVHASGGRLRGLEVPSWVNVRADYFIARVQGSEAAARDWLALALGPAGRKLFSAAGFVV